MWQIPLPEALQGALQVHGLALDEQPQHAWPLLSADEQAQAGRYRLHADRVRFAATRSAARVLLARRIGCAPAAIDIAYGLHRKPEVRGVAGRALPHAPLFNVSHCAGIALIAIGESGSLDCLGVDVERRDAALDPHALAALCCTEQERHRLAQADNAQAMFYAIWVAKEAALKAVGVGITDHLQSVCVDVRPGRQLALRSRMHAWQGLRACQLDVPEDYFAAVCWSARAAGQASDPARPAAAIQELR